MIMMKTNISDGQGIVSARAKGKNIVEKVTKFQNIWSCEDSPLPLIDSMM